MISEEASEETGESDVTGETKKEDKVTAKDLKISSIEKSEERVAFEKLRYVYHRCPRASVLIVTEANLN